MIEWLFDPPPPSQSRRGGSGNLEVFDRDLDALIRESLQNARDQRRPGREKVRVRFAVEEISGATLEAFQAAMGWTSLREHLLGVAERDYVTTSPRVRENLHRLEAEGTLRLLRIEDMGTIGLTGGEDDHDSNFNLLCRDELISPSQRRQSGGSFGLGKFVLWLFSGMYTVLFSSRMEADSGATQRFFGRALLPFHQTGRSAWDGSGWLGTPDGMRAVSVLDDEAEEVASRCHLARPATEPGTSILIVGFDEPALEEERTITEICSDMVASAARWFWPALTERQMEVLVEGFKDGHGEFSQHVHASEEVDPFVAAANETAEVTDLARGPGEVAERELEIRVPGQRRVPGVNEEPREPVTGRVSLRLRIAESTQEGLTDTDTVALQRGTGMVVQYLAPARRGLGEASFHAVLQAGLAHGDSAADHAVEEFLRASEPPAHSEWMAGTERVKAEYVPGARASLDRLLKNDIVNAIREMTREESEDSTEGPEKLRQLFPLPGVGEPPPPREPYRLTDTRASLTDSTWSFGGTFVRSRPSEEDWRFRVAVVLDQETGGSGSASRKLAIDDLSARPRAHPSGRSDGSFEVEVPAGVDEVMFRGSTKRVEDLPLGGLHRVRVSLDVRPVSDRSGT